MGSIALLLALLSGPGAAAAPAKPAPPPPQRFDFDDDQVIGRLPSADGELVDAVHRVRFGSLIRPRAHFLPELLRSAREQ